LCCLSLFTSNEERLPILQVIACATFRPIGYFVPLPDSRLLLSAQLFLGVVGITHTCAGYANYPKLSNFDQSISQFTIPLPHCRICAPIDTVNSTWSSLLPKLTNETWHFFSLSHTFLICSVGRCEHYLTYDYEL
jgi:hypothetical protein